MKSVVICGSARFASEISAFAAKLKSLGVIAYTPYLDDGSGNEWDEEKLQQELPKPFRRLIAMGLTHDHFYKMRKADAVYIFNKNAYAGVSVNVEIGYAVSLDKPIYVYEENDDELYRQILFDAAAKTPEELWKLLS